jgi:MFS family permease
VLPALAKSFHVSFGLASGVITAFLLGNVAGTIPAGWLIDRFGRRPMLIAGPLLTAAVALLVVFSDSFPELIVLRFLNGFAMQIWAMARLSVIAQSAAAGERGRLISWMFGMDNTGRLAGPVIGGFIAAAFGLRAPFVAYAVLAALALVPTMLFMQEVPDEAKPAEAGSAKPRSPLTLREIVMPRLVYFGVALFAGLSRGPVQADLLHLYAAFEYRLGPQQIGYLATAGALLAWPLSFISGVLLDRYGRKPTMVPAFTGIAVGMAGLALTAFFHLSFLWYLVTFLFSVALQALTGGSVQTIGTDVAPPEARGTFFGLWRFMGQGGQALSPIFFAFLADRVNYASSFIFVGVSAAVVTFLLIFHVPDEAEERAKFAVQRT